MRNTKLRRVEIWCLVASVGAALPIPTTAFAHIRLSSDWESGFLPDGRLVPKDENEVLQLDKAALTSVKNRTATPDSTDFALDLGFKLLIDQTKFYVKPTMFMSQSHPGEVCTQVGKATAYQCKEGTHLIQTCQLGFYDEKFREAGWQAIHINESVLVFCNAVPAMSVYDANKNEILVMVQYFDIDKKPAAQPREIGSGWKRMTVLLRLNADNGKVSVEQDDRCLGNPNRVDAIPDAKRILRNCGPNSQPSPATGARASH